MSRIQLKKKLQDTQKIRREEPTEIKQLNEFDSEKTPVLQLGNKFKATMINSLKVLSIVSSPSK